MIVGTEEIGAKAEVKDSEDLANELLGTGDDAQDQEDPPGDKPPVAPGDEIPPEEAAAEQDEPEVDEDGNPIPKEVKPDESQGSEAVNTAVERLNKAAGKELSNDEAVDMMAKSYMKADVKIQSLSEQLSEAVGYRDKYEEIVAHPIIAQILKGENPYANAAKEEGLDGEDLSPAVQKVISGLNQQITAMGKQLKDVSGGIKSGEQTRHNEAVASANKQIEGFAKKPENADFKEVLLDYREMLKLNPRAPMPEILQKLSGMMNSGVLIAEGWGVLNPKKVVTRLKGEIATKQRLKINKGGIPIRGKGKVPKVRDLSSVPEMDTEDFMNAVVANVSAREAGDE